MKLYYHPLSGYSHRARLFLSLLGIEYEAIEVDLAKGAQKAPEFLTLNPFGQVPVLDDDGTIVPDSNAILVYLAQKLGRTDWLPEEPDRAAHVQRWLTVAAGPIAYGPARARLIKVFAAPYNLDEAIAQAHTILQRVDAQLEARPFLTGESPTIADVALYSYIARAPEGDVDLSSYAHVRAWLARIEALPGFLPF